MCHCEPVTVSLVRNDTFFLVDRILPFSYNIANYSKGANTMQQLKVRYEAYVAEAIEIRKKAGPLAGILGLGGGPQDNPRHIVFYEDVQKWVSNFLGDNPGRAAREEAVRFILCAPVEVGQADSYGMMYAAHGLVRELIPGLSAECCARLQEFYDDHYPKRERMPVQKEVYKLLTKGAKGS